MTWLLLIPLALILVLVVALLGWIAYSSQNARFVISWEGLRLHGEPLYRSFVPASALRGGSARVVDLEVERELAPKWRTFGTGMPGYAAGWFRLKNGDKALVYLTNRRRVVCIPTTQGFTVLLSPTEPERLVQQIRTVAPRI